MDENDKSVQILSNITVFNKYAKYLPDQFRRENWNEIVKRNMSMHIEKYPFLENEIRDVYEKFVMNKKVLPSMRSMQFAGKSIEVSPNRIFNCSYLPMDNWKAFGEVMFLLLGGSGVGCGIQKHQIEKLPEIHKPHKKRRFLVGDSIEGWSDAVKYLMKSYFYGGYKPIFDFRDIRPKGARLITSGGKAPGYEPLKRCLTNIELILERKDDGDQLKPIEVHDILCHIADAVLAGGIRRAALISLFSFDDNEMLTCKFGKWWELNPQRGRANNTAVIIRNRIKKKEFLEMWKKVQASGSGEPGLYFSYDKDGGLNPCVTGDMIILTDSGEMTIMELIRRFRECDKAPRILTYNFEENKYEYDDMVWGGLTRHDAKVVEIETDNDVKFKTTPDHLVYTSNGWINSSMSDHDDNFIFIEKENETEEFSISSVKFKSKKRVKNENVYDIKCRNNHNFFINGILVHNCGEVALRANQFCNLTEINVSNVESQEDLNDRAKAASFIGTLQAGYTDFHYLRPVWEKMTEKEALIGVGMTGIASGNVLSLDLKQAADMVKEENVRVSSLIGINPAARTTTVKPSGTSSCVLGCSSGIHAWHSKYYIRRFRIMKNESLYKYLEEHNPELVEDEYFNPLTTAIIQIPQKAPENAILRSESAFDLLERIKKFYTEWIVEGHVSGYNTHNVSATVSLKDDEWDDVGEWMWKNRDCFNGLSVLPYDCGSYQQPPFEEIDEKTFLKMSKNLKDINLDDVLEYDDTTELKGEVACSGGACELKNF